MVFSLKEVGYILAAIVVLFFVVNFQPLVTGNFTLMNLLFSLLLISIMLLTNILAKKLAAYYYQAKIEIEPWKWYRFGFKRESHFKRPVYAGIFVPIIFSIISYGYFFWLAVLEFDVFSTTSRVSKMHGSHRYTEMTEFHIGMIAAAGVLANLLLAIIAYLIGIPQLTSLSVFLACFSMIPIGQLDGSKIFFAGGGSIRNQSISWGIPTLWFFLAIICAIFLSFVLFFPY